MQALLNARVPSSVMAKTHKEAYDLGAMTMPVLALIPMGCFAYLAKAGVLESVSLSRRAFDIHNDALIVSSSSPGFYYYSFAAVMMPSIAVFTMTAMVPCNSALHRKADEADAELGEDNEVASLIKQWQWLNAARSALIAAGCLSATYAVVSIDVWA